MYYSSEQIMEMLRMKRRQTNRLIKKVELSWCKLQENKFAQIKFNNKTTYYLNESQVHFFIQEYTKYFQEKIARQRNKYPVILAIDRSSEHLLNYYQIADMINQPLEIILHKCLANKIISNDFEPIKVPEQLWIQKTEPIFPNSTIEATAFYFKPEAIQWFKSKFCTTGT